MKSGSLALTRRILTALCLAAFVPLLHGCSVFGIATSGDLTDAENRLKAENRLTNQRLDQAEQRHQDAQGYVDMLSARLDTLDASFAQAADWIQSLDFEGISEQASDASQAAIAIQEQNRAFMTKYLEWLKAQQALLAEQVEMIEAKMDASGTAGPPQEEQAAPEQSESTGTDQ